MPICLLNLKFLIQPFLRYKGDPKIVKVAHVTPSRPHIDLTLHFIASTLRGQSSCQIWSFYRQPSPRYRGSSKILKVGHVTPSGPHVKYFAFSTAFAALKLYVKFDADRLCSSMTDVDILRLRRFGLEMPIAAHFGRFFPGFDPVNVVIYCRDLQKAHPWLEARVLA